jgi:hypothetical protein
MSEGFLSECPFLRMRRIPNANNVRMKLLRKWRLVFKQIYFIKRTVSRDFDDLFMSLSSCFLLRIIFNLYLNHVFMLNF